MKIRTIVRGLAKTIAAVVLVIAIPAVVAVGWIELACRPQPTEAFADQLALAIDEAGYKRELANSYFTFPEWYIVYSAEDLGRFLETRSESAFSYLSQIAGFWQGYCEVNRVAGGLPGDYLIAKFNLYVIGLSYSFEYAVIGLYENTIGRLTEWLRGPAPTIEDGYARAVMQHYGAFMHELPFYDYPFFDTLIGLWAAAPLVGDSPVRNVERHAWLSAVYAFKLGYSTLIKAGQAATGELGPFEIKFVVRGDPAALMAEEPEVHLVRRLPEGLALLEAPRFKRFTQLLKRLAEANVEVVEIAGNRRILVSVIAPESATPAIPGANRLFSLPIDARPGFRRVGYDADVTRLAGIVSGFKTAGIEVEHFYDY
jgi:hypothetical protein